MIARAAFSILNLPIIKWPPANPSKRRTTSSLAKPKNPCRPPRFTPPPPLPCPTRRIDVTGHFKTSQPGSNQPATPRCFILNTVTGLLYDIR